MQNIDSLLTMAAKGTLGACARCPWNPAVHPSIAFGVSCERHGTRSPERVVSMQVVQDPGGTTPATTGRLCFICNSANPTDRSAGHAYDLWKAAVALDGSERFIEGHYWTNAIMHGAPRTPRELRARMEQARIRCQEVLSAQVAALKPKVIVATGKSAADSLVGIGLLRRPWDAFKDRLGDRPHHELRRLSSGESVDVFVSYHTSIGVVNRTVSRRHSERTELAVRSAEEASFGEGVQRFLTHYSGDGPEARGMRVLLSHWIPIGRAIRKAHAG